MGLYNLRKLNNLRNQLEAVASCQHRLLQIQTVTINRLQYPVSLLNDLVAAAQIDTAGALLHHKLHIIQTQLPFQLQVIRAVQAAHHWRLSIDMLNSTHLHDLFWAAQTKAKIN
jgi:hypothetical protein